MTVNINAASISSVQLAAAQTPSAPNSGFVRLHHNANSRLAMRPSTGDVVEFLGNTSGIGAGITFPNSASTSATTLDWYEEGTFTPIIRGSGTAGTGTYGSRGARHTRIGRLVHFELYMEWTNLTGQSGTLAVGGLPFTSADVLAFPAVSISEPSNISLTANNVLVGYVQRNSTYILLQQYPVGGGAVTNVSVDTAGSIMIQGVYSV